MALRVCPLCQAEFLETKTTCTHCNVALVDLDDDTDPRSLDTDQQVVYDLAEWPLDAVSEIAQVLAESGLPHAWDGVEVVVPLVHEASADRLFEVVEDDYGLVSAGDEGDDGDGASPTRGDTEYDMVGWPAQRRAELVGRLVEHGIPHRWEGDLLVVASSLEESVEALLDEFGAGLDEDDEDDEDDEVPDLDPAEILSGLFLAGERMRRKRADLDSYAGLLGCLEVADPDETPYGVEGRIWTKALQLGEQLADSVADDAEDTEEIAEELYQLLRPIV